MDFKFKMEVMFLTHFKTASDDCMNILNSALESMSGYGGTDYLEELNLISMNIDPHSELKREFDNCVKKIKSMVRM